jgi:hypothetical protein
MINDVRPNSDSHLTKEQQLVDHEKYTKNSTLLVVDTVMLALALYNAIQLVQPQFGYRDGPLQFGVTPVCQHFR